MSIEQQQGDEERRRREEEDSVNAYADAMIRRDKGCAGSDYRKIGDTYYCDTTRGSVALNEPEGIRYKGGK